MIDLRIVDLGHPCPQSHRWSPLRGLCGRVENASLLGILPKSTQPATPPGRYAQSERHVLRCIRRGRSLRGLQRKTVFSDRAVAFRRGMLGAKTRHPCRGSGPFGADSAESLRNAGMGPSLHARRRPAGRTGGGFECRRERLCVKISPLLASSPDGRPCEDRPECVGCPRVVTTKAV